MLSMSIFARHILVSERLCPGTFVECRTGPDGAKDLLTVLKGPDRQGGSECH